MFVIAAEWLFSSWEQLLHSDRNASTDHTADSLCPVCVFCRGGIYSALSGLRWKWQER